MEKRLVKFKTIVVSGPESTGKTNIASHLARKFNFGLVPEYARAYVENLGRPYTYEDVESIAKKQIEDYHFHTRNNSIVIFDTWLVITRVWFEKVYGKYPAWLQENLENLKIDLYLLCAPDLEWVPDPVRENGGLIRKELFKTYENEIKKLAVPYGIVKGKGEERFQSAEEIIHKYSEKL